MSELDFNILLRHTRLLLRSYPKSYRAHRGEEILDTLLETTRPGRGWPPPREVASVIGAGLRARRAANLSAGLGTSLRQVGILAAAMMVAVFASGWVADLLELPQSPVLRQMALGEFPAIVLGVLAVVAAWRGRRRLVLAAVAVGVVLAGVMYGTHADDGLVTWVMLAITGGLALVVLAPLTRRADRPPVSLLFILGVPAAAELARVPLGNIGVHDALPISRIMAGLTGQYDTYLSLLTVVVAVCWLVTDVRPLAAVAAQFLLFQVEIVISQVVYVAEYGFHGHSVEMAQTPVVVILFGAALAVTGALVWLLYRRARATPPAIG